MAAVAFAVLAFAVATRDPAERIAVGVVIGSAGIGVGALAAWIMFGGAASGHGRRARARAAVALRRGAAVGLVVSILATLRVADGLTPITAAFVVLAFALAEVTLSARAS
ncbi:MAG: hypothetical protein HY071_03340 [Chloroflexi bacterium]|nr:hypothetical protein [Chloroflexota bacterium]